jgi:hypothetical protein
MKSRYKRKKNWTKDQTSKCRRRRRNKISRAMPCHREGIERSIKLHTACNASIVSKKKEEGREEKKSRKKQINNPENKHQHSLFLPAPNRSRS